MVFISKRDGKYDRQIESNGFTFFNLNLTRGMVSVGRNIIAIFELARLLLTVKADLLHSYTIQCILMGTIAGKLGRVKLFVNSFTGLGSVLGRSGKPTASQRLLVAALRFVMYRGNFKIVTQNSADYRQIISLRLRPAEDVALVQGSGVNLRNLPCKTISSTTETTVVCLARLIKDKGIMEYVQAADIVAAKAPNTRFLLAGSEDHGNPNSIPAPVIDSWRRKSNVEFLGHVDEPLVLLARSDVLVLPSYREGLPRSILEAFAMALPVVTTDVPGCKDLVEHGVNGLVVPPRHTEALAQAILYLAESPAHRHAFGNSGRRLVEDRYSGEAHAKEMKAIYAALRTVS